MQVFIESMMLYVLLCIVAIIATIIVWKFGHKILNPKVPSGPAAFGRGFAFIFPILPLCLFLIWYLFITLSFIIDTRELVNKMSYLHFVLVLISPIVAGYISARSYEKTNSIGGVMVSATAFLPYVLIVLVVTIGKPNMFKWLPILLFIPMVFAGAWGYSKRPNQ